MRRDNGPDDGQVRHQKPRGVAPARGGRRPAAAISPSGLGACYKAAFQTYDELAGRSADFKLIYESWQKFLADSNLWFRIAENTLDNYRFAMSAQPR